MAIDTIAAVTAVLPAISAKYGRNAWMREAQLLSKCVLERARSKAVDWDVSTSGATVTNPNRGDDVQSSEFAQDNRLKMSLERATYRTSFGFTDSELGDINLYSPEVVSDIVYDYVAKQVNSHLAALFFQMEVDAFKGTGVATSPLSASSVNLIGLLSGLKTSGTYAGQDVGTYPELKTNLTSVGGNLTRTQIRTALAQIHKRSGQQADFFMCSPGTNALLDGITDTNVRFGNFHPGALNQSKDVFATNFAPSTWGPSTVSFFGIPVLVNPAWDDGYLVAGRMDDFSLDYKTIVGYGDAVMDKQLAMVSSNGVDARQIPLPVRMYTLAKNGPSIKFVMEIEAQFKIANPRATALLTGITGVA